MVVDDGSHRPADIIRATFRLLFPLLPDGDGIYAIEDTQTSYDLMAKVLTRYGFEGRNVTVHVRRRPTSRYLWEMLQGALPGRRVRLVEPDEFRADLREEGKDWSATAETMVGLKRLDNIRTASSRCSPTASPAT